MARKAKPKTKNQKTDEMVKAEVRVSDAILRFPTSEEKTREEFITTLNALQSEAAEAAGAIGNHKKRLQTIYGVDPVVPPIIQRLAKLPEGRRAVVIRQMDHLIEWLKLDSQLELPLHPPGSRAPDAGPVFDQTKAGERHGKETADQARAGKRADNGHVKGRSAPGLSPEEALKGFQEANEKVARGRGELNSDDKPGTYEIQ